MGICEKSGTDLESYANAEPEVKSEEKPTEVKPTEEVTAEVKPV